MKLTKMEEKLNTVLNEVKSHKEYNALTQLLELQIPSDGRVCGMLNDGVIHSISVTPVEVEFGATTQYVLFIINTKTGENGKFYGSIRSIRTILGMDYLYVDPLPATEPHITITQGYTNIHVFKKNIMCISVIDEDIELWVKFNMIDRETQFPVHIADNDMLLSFSEYEYDNIVLACDTMNNLVSDLLKQVDDDDDLY